MGDATGRSRYGGGNGACCYDSPSSWDKMGSGGWLSYFIGSPFKKYRSLSVGVGVFGVCMLRYLCSFLSGILIWGAYAPEDMPVWLYSLTYNGSYMIPEAVLSTVVAIILVKTLDAVFPAEKSPVKGV